MTSPEERLKEALKHGTCVQFNSDESHEIAGDWLADLLAGRVILRKRHAKGLIVTGARITGAVQWSNDRFVSQFAFESCTFDEPIAAAGLRVKGGGASFSRSTIPNLNISDGVIDGHLDLTGINIRGRGPAEGATLNLNGITIAGSLKMNSATVCGKTDVVGADIGGDFDCDSAKLTNPGGMALVGNAIKVTYSLRLTNVVASGEVSLLAATIKYQLNCGKSHMINPDGDALSLDRAKVNGHAFLNDGFVASGTVRLFQTQIQGRLDCQGGSLKGAKTALYGESMTVAGRLDLRELAEKPVGVINLRDAKVGQLCDDANSWPEPQHSSRRSMIILTGFIYDHFAARPDMKLADRISVDDRIAWVQIQTGYEDGYAPEPYLQLASVYARAGEDSDHRKVLIALRDDRRKYGELRWFQNLWEWLLKFLIGYGRQLWRAGIAIFIVYAISVGIVWLAKDFNGFVAVGPTADQLLRHPQALDSNTCTNYYPCLSQFIYPVDAAIPLINLHQSEFWAFSAFSAWGQWGRYLFDLVTLLGWFFSSLLVAGLAGLIRTE